jgi:DNA polymerase-4
VEPGEELSFLHRLPIQTLWGVGRVTQQRLRKHQIATIGDIARTDLAQLQRWFGEHGRRLHELSQGIDPRRVESNRQRKQISHEDTYALDLVGLEAIRERLLSQATRVADRLVTKGRRGRCVHLKIRDTAFTTETRQRVLPEPTQHARVIYATACDLLGAIQTDGRRFRLTGVGISDLVEARCPAQLDLPLSDPRPDRLQGVLTEIRQRYGHQALYPASAGGELRRGSAGAASRSIDREDDSNRSK